MDKILVVCGPTAVGKTSFAIDIAKQIGGEIVSADSRQVEKGMDIITGKDLPENAQLVISNLQWRDKKLGYYQIDGVKVWLYDIVSPDEEFNVSFWKECAELIISDIISRGARPIVVGGTGLYIKSLTTKMDTISIKPDKILRNRLANFTREELFEYLNNINHQKALSLNESDKKNPRRLIRAIEIASATSARNDNGVEYSFLKIGLKSTLDNIFSRIDQKIQERISRGAKKEFDLITHKYDRNLPSMTSTGYSDWEKWALREKQYVKRQMTWFTKEPDIHWFDVQDEPWRGKAVSLVNNWYN